MEASGSVVSKAEKVEVTSSDFDSVITLTSFSSEPLLFQKIIGVLLDFENQQLRTMHDVPFHVNMVEVPLNTTVAGPTHDGGRSLSGSNRSDFRPRVQCQICSHYGHSAQ